MYLWNFRDKFNWEAGITTDTQLTQMCTTDLYRTCPRLCDSNPLLSDVCHQGFQESSKAVTFEIPILPPQLLPLNQVLISHHLYSRLWTYRLDNRMHSAVLKAWQCWSQCSELGLQCDSTKLCSCSNAGHASEGQVTEKPFISLWHKKRQ